MLYIGGGAGMAPMRAHISHLLETETSDRTISYWYGARSKVEIFYDDYFSMLQSKHRNFRFALALSEPKKEDNWRGHTGYVHEVVFENYLKHHQNLREIAFYLCGPPAMITACKQMLAALKVKPAQIAYDAFS